MRHSLGIAFSKNSYIKNTAIIFSLVAFMIGGMVHPLYAQTSSQLQQEIDALNEEIDQSQSEIERLRDRGDSLENQLEIYQAERRQIQADIDKTERDIDKTRAEISEKEAELEQARERIQENAKTLYKEGEPSTIEILFSSTNFTDFINRQEYLSSARSSMEEAAEESVRLKGELEEREEDLQSKSQRLDGQRQQLVAKEAEQEDLLEETQGEEDRYQQIVSRQESERSRLEERQRRAYEEELAAARSQNQFVSSGGGGSSNFSGTSSYPYAGSSVHAVDKWGLFARQCVSYTAWKVESTGRFVPHFGGQGHARQWPATTAAHGISNGMTPKKGSVAVSNIGHYGHTMYVEEVLDGGASIRISEYNLIPYEYSERIIPAAGLTYIYF